MIKLIALDLDGTLLNSDHQISQTTLSALKEVMANGIQLMIATGKTPFSAVEVKKELGLQTWGVFSQGLTILDQNDTIAYQNSLPDEISRKAVQLLEAKTDAFDFVIYNIDGLFTIRPSSFDRFLTDHHEPYPIATGSADQLANHLPFQKILIKGERPDLEQLKADLITHFGDLAHFVFSLETVLEIVPAGSSKGDGVERALKRLGITAEEMIAFGDGDNDIEFLSKAGTGIAMGNGTPAAKSAADYVTLTNDQDGIPHALYHFGLLKKGSPEN